MRRVKIISSFASRRMISSKRVIPVSESKRLVTVCALQMSMTNDVKQNLLTAESMVRLAALKGGQIILLPELFSNLYFCQDQLAENFSLALPNDINNNFILKKFQQLSKELNVCLPVSFFERANQAYYNSCAVFDGGRYLGIYRKSHIPDGPGYTEKFYFNPGDTGFQVFETQFDCKFGIGICWDQWFPETARLLALKGAEIIFYPTAIGSEPQDPNVNSQQHWTNAMIGHAACNLTPVIASNRIGSENEILFYGGSFIADHTGQVVKKFEKEQECGILTHTFDLTEVKDIRRGWGVFRDRRPELYSALLTRDGGPNVTTRDYSSGIGYNEVIENVVVIDIKLSNTPIEDGFIMPAEWHRHKACYMAYPYKKSIWYKNAVPAQKAVISIAKAISKFEPVILLVKPEFYEQVKNDIGLNTNIKLAVAEYDDIWLRDTGPTFLIKDREVRGVNWKFNGWGNKVDQLDIEDSVSLQILKLASKKGYSSTEAVLEGGSIHVDGNGTLITTEECVLNENRATTSFSRSKESMENLFRKYLGVKKVIFIPNGVYGDEDTNGHIDNLATFIRPGEVVLTFPEDESSPQYPISKQAYDILTSSTDANGNLLIVHKIPSPWPMMVTTKEDLEGLELGSSDGLVRNEGTILAGSYINYYLANGEFGKGIVMPKFGIDTDIRAFEIMQKLFPDREVIMVDARDILLGGGNIHCITQQEPF